MKLLLQHRRDLREQCLLLGQHSCEAFGITQVDPIVARTHEGEEAFILAYRGIPLIYSGDEIATLNDQRYRLDPAKVPEGRWVHRPFFDWKRAQKRNDVGTFEYRVFQQLKQLIKQRKALPYLHGQSSQIAVDLVNPHVFGIVRTHNGKTFFALFNFSENTQIVSTEYLHPLLVGTRFADVFQGREFDVNDTQFDLSPYEFVWCIAKKEQ